MKNIFKNPWAKGGEYYPEEVLNVDRVLFNNLIIPETAIDNFPSFATLLKNYPGFGDTSPSHPCDIPEYYNQCSIRVSTAFSLSGHTFEKQSSNHKVDFCPKHGYNHIRSAITFATNLLIKKYGYGKFVDFTPKSFKDKFKINLNESNFDLHFGTKTGVIYQRWGADSVHIDLYNKEQTGSGNYMDYVGSSTEKVARFMFWEIK